jgi:hypothetical protein
MKGAGAPVVGMAEIIRRAKMSQKNPTMEKPAYPENMKEVPYLTKPKKPKSWLILLRGSFP